MDAREQLRRYLEQRREMGETELVLDTLGVDEALKLIGLKQVPAATPPMIVREQSPAYGGGGDWREALRAAGAAPESERPQQSKPPQPPQPPHPAEQPLLPITRNQIPAAPAPISSPDLAAIAADVATCTRCPLYATATNPVPGEGNPNADFMCVGEAPGATEDELGRPFVGAAGQLLTKILEAINLSREQVFICNVLKHRPPGNRNPLPEEVIACSPYLVRQIQIIRPKVILALGSFAAQALLQTKLSLGRLRGQVHEYHGVPVVVTYHPAALLRNPSWKRPTWEDVQLARRILDRADKPGA